MNAKIAEVTVLIFEHVENDVFGPDVFCVKEALRNSIQRTRTGNNKLGFAEICQQAVVEISHILKGQERPTDGTVSIRLNAASIEVQSVSLAGYPSRII